MRTAGEINGLRHTRQGRNWPIGQDQQRCRSQWFAQQAFGSASESRLTLPFDLGITRSADVEPILYYPANSLIPQGFACANPCPVNYPGVVCFSPNYPM